MSWKWQDGSATTSSFDNCNDTMQSSHAYSVPGKYKVIVEAVNLVTVNPGVSYQLSSSEQVIVQHPPHNLKVY